MSGGMGDNGGFGKGLSAKMNISARGHNTGNSSVVHHVLAVIPNDNFSNTALHDFISQIMCSSELPESTWIMKSIFQPPSVLNSGCNHQTKTFCTTNERVHRA